MLPLNFNSHAHVERDSTLCIKRGIYIHFNSHAHVERDEVQMSFTEMQVKFQLTRSRGAWQFSCFKGIDRTLFQLTRSRGAWRSTYIPDTMLPLNFNSHAHVERDGVLRYKGNALDTISTHTLTWSVTCKKWVYLNQNSNFNSHAHVERDQT